MDDSFFFIFTSFRACMCGHFIDSDTTHHKKDENNQQKAVKAWMLFSGNKNVVSPLIYKLSAGSRRATSQVKEKKDMRQMQTGKI